MSDLVQELRQLLVSALRLDRDPSAISATEELFGDGLGLDSVDGLQLLVAVERHYQIELTHDDLTRNPWSSLSSLASLVEQKRLP